MAQPTSSCAPINFPYRVNAFGWDSTNSVYVEACAYQLAREQESVEDYSNKSQYLLRARQGIQQHVEAGQSMVVTWYVDQQKSQTATIAPNASDDYAPHTFNSAMPNYPWGIGLHNATFANYKHPRFYCLELHGYSSSPDADHDDHCLMRGVMLEHKYDRTPSTTKVYRTNRYAPAARIYAAYHSFSAYHARRLLRDSYNKMLQEARQIMCTPLYSAEDITFRAEA